MAQRQTTMSSFSSSPASNAVQQPPHCVSCGSPGPSVAGAHQEEGNAEAVGPADQGWRTARFCTTAGCDFSATATGGPEHDSTCASSLLRERLVQLKHTGHSYSPPGWRGRCNVSDALQGPSKEGKRSKRKRPSEAARAREPLIQARTAVSRLPRGTRRGARGVQARNAPEAQKGLCRRCRFRQATRHQPAVAAAQAPPLTPTPQERAWKARASASPSLARV